jgi:hypothetical protein
VVGWLLRTRDGREEEGTASSSSPCRLALLSSRAAVVAGEPTIEVFTDDTTLAPVSVGKLWDGSCSGLTNCQNDCRSIFYKVTGGSASITATSCGASAFQQRLYVWAGTGSVCSTFTCASAYRIGCSYVCMDPGVGSAVPCRAVPFFWKLTPALSLFVASPPRRPTAANSGGCNYNGVDDGGDDDDVPAGARVAWQPMIGAEYYVQATGDDPDGNDYGTYRLTLSSAASFSATKVEGE